MMILKSDNLRRLAYLVSVVALLMIPPSLPWRNFWLLRLLSPGVAVALAVKSIDEFKEWEREVELSAMRWQANLAKEEEILQVMVAEVVPRQLPQQSVALLESSDVFDWNDFRDNPNQFPHLRIIGKTGSGKTLLADWLLDVLGGEVVVVTPKKRWGDWTGLRIIGCTPEPFDYDAIAQYLDGLVIEMYERYKQIDNGVTPVFLTVVIDEWRLISQKVERAKDIMRELITVAREANIRIIALAQGEQVETWGLKGESHVGECFASIRIGRFAVEHLRMQQSKMSAETFTQRLAELERQGYRCCTVDDVPARIPNLAGWSRGNGG